MKRLKTVLGILIVAYSCLGAIILIGILHDYSFFYPAKGRWKLVWEDDFNGPMVERNKWTALNKSTGLSKELQASTAQNVTVNDGCLIITSQKEKWNGPDVINPQMAVTRHYTSGQAATLENAVWTYGRFEITAKLPAGQGILPYVLLYPTDNSWPPEIVIMAALGNRPRDVMFVNIWGPDARRQHSESSGLIEGREDFSVDFHTFTLEWEPDALRWYIDGVLKYRLHRNIPDIPLCLVIGTSIGGFAGKPNDKESGGKPASFPQSFYIARVRVYQRR